ncbi:MAG: hypothetical protein MR270_06465 [Erysipelotrichaceae bacterium]|nr:hypothetical protein [Erysipelotrichaceae bacterium]
MILAISNSQIFNIIHLCCYIIASLPAAFIALSIDYVKIMKAKSNKVFYVIAFGIAASFTFLIGEFIYNIVTMFIY